MTVTSPKPPPALRGANSRNVHRNVYRNLAVCWQQRRSQRSSEVQSIPEHSLSDGAPQGGQFVPAEKEGSRSVSDVPRDAPGSSGPWKCVPFESDLQPAVQREGEGEGEAGIAAAT